MGTKAVLGLVPRSRIVNRDPGRGVKARAQHLLGFAEKGVLLGAEQAHDLPLGDIDAQIVKLAEQAWNSNLPLVVLAQDEALDLWAEMAGYPLW